MRNEGYGSRKIRIHQQQDERRSICVMKLRLAVFAKNERVEVDANPFTIRMRDGVFAVVAPMFDDWTRTENFDLRSTGAIINADVGGLIIEFPDEAGLNQFQTWLNDANAKAEHGYKTMWP